MERDIRIMRAKFNYGARAIPRLRRALRNRLFLSSFVNGFISDRDSSPGRTRRAKINGDSHVKEQRLRERERVGDRDVSSLSRSTTKFHSHRVFL